MTLGRRGAEIKARYVILADSLHVSRILRDAGLATPLKAPGGSPEAFCIPFFQMARMFINDCFPAMLMRMAVEAMLYFGKIARAYESFCHATDIDLASLNAVLVEADDYLKSATWLCDNFPFQNAEALKATVQETQTSLQKPWFEDVTLEEVASVKYVVSVMEGPFYTCEKGHPVRLFSLILSALKQSPKLTSSSSHLPSAEPPCSWLRARNAVHGLTGLMEWLLVVRNLLMPNCFMNT